MHCCLRTLGHVGDPRPKGATFLLLVFVLTSWWLGAPAAHAGAIYTLTFKVGQPGPLVITGSTPLQQDNSWSQDVATFPAAGYALPGRVGMTQGVIDGPPGGAFADEARANATADDFLITGPAGATTVTGTMHFRAVAYTSVSFGSNSNSTGAGGYLDFTWVNQVQPVGAHGQCSQGGATSSGSGFMSTFVPPGGPFAASFTATFPVGTPFTISMGVDAYGGVYTLPANVQATLTGAIGDATGHVIDLAPGYSLGSAEWGIVGGSVVPTAERSWGQVKAIYR